MHRINTAIELIANHLIRALHYGKLATGTQRLFAAVRALWQVIFIDAQRLVMNKRGFVIIDFHRQHDARRIAIKVGGNHFEIQCQAIAIQRVINRCRQCEAVSTIAI